MQRVTQLAWRARTMHVRYARWRIEAGATDADGAAAGRALCCIYDSGVILMRS